MARAKKKIEYSTFVKGLNTDAGPLTYPEDSSLVDTNFVLNTDGSRQRRKGLTYEDNYQLATTVFPLGEDVPTTSYVWKSVNSSGFLDISVVQVGERIWFYDNNVIPLSTARLNSGFSLHYPGLNRKLSFTESYGKLVIAGYSRYISVVSYDETTDSISSQIVNLKVRDIFGVDDGLKEDFRPSDITSAHLYNLKNQGWPDVTECITVSSNGEFSGQYDPLYITNLHLGIYPSNSDTLGMGEQASTVRSYTVGAYSPWKLQMEHGGSVEAPKGYFIISPFQRGFDRSYESGINGLPTDKTDGYISSTSAYAGRLFYAIHRFGTTDLDENSPELSSMIFFSRSSSNITDFGKCYSKNDPTSKHFFDILDTDGGFINIPDVGEIYSLTTLGESLFVISSKGVWEINGGDNYFSATNQNINKISDFGAISGSSVISGETAISFWAQGGIYLINIDKVSMSGVVTNITNNVVQTLYEDIPTEVKRTAVGVYDEVAKQIRWLYREGTLPSSYFFNRELVFDTNLSAFYTNEIQEIDTVSGRAPYVVGYIALSQYNATNTAMNVVVGADNIVVGLDNVTGSLRERDEATKSAIKFWCLEDQGTGFAALTAAGYVNFDFLDWSYTQDSLGNFGKDAPAELITGYNTDGDAEIDKKAKYITTYLKRTETGFEDLGGGEVGLVGQSSCKLQGQWDWTNSAAAGRWSSEAEVYRLPRFYAPESALDPFDYSFTVVKTKNKMRGKGSSLSLRFTSSPGKDLHLYGWSRELTVPAD